MNPKHAFRLRNKKTVFLLCALGPKVIKLFSCSTQLSTKFILLINGKMPQHTEQVFKIAICIFVAMFYGRIPFLLPTQTLNSPRTPPVPY